MPKFVGILTFINKKYPISEFLEKEKSLKNVILVFLSVKKMASWHLDYKTFMLHEIWSYEGHPIKRENFLII